MAGQTQTSGDQTPVRPTRSGRGLRWALGISLALNLAVVGMVAGAMLRDGSVMRGAMVRDLGFGPFTEALSREDRRALRQALFERAPEIRQARQQRQEDLQALVAILRAEPFDAAALAAAMAEQEARMVGQLRLGQTVLQERIAAMTPEARRGFAERLEDGLNHGGRRSQKD